MPMIRPSSYLRNNYNEISKICHETKDAVYITKNGTGDLAVMSIELYEDMIEKFEIYERIKKTLQEIEQNKLEKDSWNEIEKEGTD